MDINFIFYVITPNNLESIIDGVIETIKDIKLVHSQPKQFNVILVMITSLHDLI